MKKLIVILVANLFMVGFIFCQNNFHNTHILDPYNPEYVPGEVLIKFRDEVKVKAEVESKRGNTVVSTGLKSVDQFLAERNAVNIEKLFSETRESRQNKTGGKKLYMTDFRGQQHEVPPLFNIYKISFEENQDAKTLSKLLSQDPSVDYAEPNYLVYTSGHSNEMFIPSGKSTTPPNRNVTPNDPLYNQQSGLVTTQVDQVWDTITGDSSQVIAILDTGIDWLHPDLADNIWMNDDEIAGNHTDDDGNGKIDDIRGWDYINNDNNPMDDNSHGTHVAGIAGARGNNGIGIAGVNWYVKLMALKVFKSDGTGDAATISQGINYAAENDATILNMSFGGYGRSITMETALQNAYLTADLVASAGNGGVSIYTNDPENPTVHYPAALSYVLGIQAPSPFSNYDPDGPLLSTFPDNFNYELTAPGSSILSTAPNGNYISMTGTSMSAPLVSGVISLFSAQFPSTSSEEMWGNLIHTSTNCIQAYNAFFPTGAYPYFDLTNFSLEDTLPGNDQDGQADAGELIQIYTTVRNTWAYADSAYALLSNSIYGDTTDVDLVNDSVFFGNMSTYGSLINLSDPFLIRIDSNCFNNRNVTMNLMMKNAGDTAEFIQEIDFTIYNGEELGGILTNDTTLTPDKLWVVNNNLRVSTGITLTILPGTHLKINAQIDNRGFISAAGTPDSMIYIDGNGFSNNGTFEYIYFDLDENIISVNADLVNCIFNNGSTVSARTNNIKSCTIKNFGSGSSTYLSIGADSIINTSISDCIMWSSYTSESHYKQCIFDNVICWPWHSVGSISYCTFDDITNWYVYYYPNHPNNWDPVFIIQSDYNDHLKNSFLHNNHLLYYVKATGGNDYLEFPNHYWGSTDENKIQEKYYDFNQNASLPYLIVDPILTQPSDSCPGHVWKVQVNDVDAQDGSLDPLGAGTHKFEVFFNRAMDTTLTPLVTFGLRSPYLQNTVEDSAAWSDNKTKWTAYHTVDLFTGDGIHTIRVADAQDSTGSEIPVEDDRFTFVIQAAGVQSVNFMATAGIGKVDLEWNSTGLEDFLGFNMYRYMSLTDSTYSDPAIVNNTLITDTVYTDYSVIPDSTYHYYYKIVDTDLLESDSSNIITATPFDAANGDANGDLSVDVLDITTIVSYMLNQNPQPFLFDAADVNYDGEINVLDIIGCVQLISGKKSAPLSGFVDISEDVAYYDLKTNKITLESEGNLAGLQFEVQNLLSTTNHQLPTLKIFSLQKGFEFACAPLGDKVIGVLYSLTGKTLPAGEISLFRFEGCENNQLEITDIFGGDPDGDYVPVLKKGEQIPQEPGSAYDLNIQPNPFREFTTISWKLADRSKVTIEFYDMEGKKVDHLIEKVQDKGSYQMDWQAGNLQAGVYICHMEAISINGLHKIKKDKKIVLMK